MCYESLEIEHELTTDKHEASQGLSATAELLVIFGPLHISVTNGARKLKFGTVVGIYEY